MNGSELLREFRNERSERAFAELVNRYAGLVFSVAKRRLSNDGLAQEVSQSVFIRLARNPPDLPTDSALVAWLHRTAVHVSVDAWRAESRRRTREQQAAAMQTETSDSFDSSNSLTLALDEALDELAESDRSALLLRFFDGRKMAELGAILGVSEDAAKMRVGRSLERLRERLAVRGIKTTAALLTVYLGEQAVIAVPPIVAVSILQAVPVGVPAAVSAALPSKIAQIVRPRFAALLVAIVIPTILLIRLAKPPGNLRAGARAQASAGVSATTPGFPLSGVAAVETNNWPDPRALLEGVLRARSRIVSGSMEIGLVHDQIAFHPVRETNLIELRIVFDGVQRRFEQTGIEYSYVGVNEEGERSQKTINEKKMTRAEAVRAGLLKPFESRHVSTCDGTTILDYWENDGRTVSATIDRADKGGGSQYLFDPRLLGLGTGLSDALESSLALTCAQDVKILGEDAVEGEPAWHIQVTCANYKPEFWVSIKQPDHLLKRVAGVEIFVCRYSQDHPRDPLPMEVLHTLDHPNAGRFTTRFFRRATEYNSVVDQEVFTLNGLGMQIGTWVVDKRSSRSPGYWNGAGFSPKRPKENDAIADGPKAADLLDQLEKEPETHTGLEAAVWIIQNTPDGDGVEKAGRAILNFHLRSTNLLGLAERFEQLRPRCAKPILKGLLASNPDIETRAVACLSLGLTYLDEANFGVNKEAARDARTYLNRVLSDFMKTKKGYARQHYAKTGIQQIDNFFVGHKAPNLRAETIQGELIDTAALSGQVILLIFSTGSSYEYRKTLEEFDNQPVRVIEISCSTKLQETMARIEKDRITWPVSFDGNYGPIAKAWLVDHWTTTFLINTRGFICARDLRGPELVKAIEGALH
jgi:RNA polymerase sigma factor (sigma-70 family)